MIHEVPGREAVPDILDELKGVLVRKFKEHAGDAVARAVLLRARDQLQQLGRQRVGLAERLVALFVARQEPRAHVCLDTVRGDADDLA